MSEFCFECYKKYFYKNAKKKNFLSDNELDLCEGCGKYKVEAVIIVKERAYFDMFINWF